MDTVLIALGTSLSTAFAQWIFYQRKHKANAVGFEKDNDRKEIDNLKLVATEWRESAQVWKDLADSYQMALVDLQVERSKFRERVISSEAKTQRLEDQLLRLEKRLKKYESE